jgi:hypothetical protein
MNMTPNDPRTEASTCKSSGTQPENSKASIARIQALTLKETTSTTHMKVHTNKESRKKQPGRKPGPNWDETGLGRTAQADRPSLLWARFDAPFALGVRLFIASASVGCLTDPIILLTPLTRKPPLSDEGESRMRCRKDQRRWREGSKRRTPSRWPRGVPKLHHRHLHQR